MRQASAYLKIILGEKIVGGLIVFHRSRGNFYLGRIFLDPDYHHQGLGLGTIEMLLERYPEASRWKLDTPVWNRRTHAFYHKLGFSIYKEKDGLLYFEKLVA
jgi:GNAT superfamily N-acetyltransferase